MSRRVIRPLAASACLLTIAAAGIALQPAEGGRAQRSQPTQPGQPGQPQPGEPGGPGGRGETRAPSVGGSMKGMNRAVRQLARQIDDTSKKEENLRLINDIERGCVNAKGAKLPDQVLAHAKDDAAREKLTNDFRTDLIQVMRVLLDMETAVADGKTADAKAKLDELVKLRDHGHEEMGLKEEKEEGR